MILNIETSADICSVALSDGNRLVDYREEAQGMKSSALLTVFIGDLLKKHCINISDLDAIAVSKGPGSYTGLRIGVSVAKGLCYGSGVPLLGVSTLESLSSGYISALAPELHLGMICPLIDARRMEVYTALFNFSGVLLSPVEARIIDSESFAGILEMGPVHFIGNAVPKCREVLSHPNAVFFENISLSARNLPDLSHKAWVQQSFEDVAYFEPYYLKDFMTTKSKKVVLGTN